MKEKYNVLATGETKDVFLMRNNIFFKPYNALFCTEYR